MRYTVNHGSNETGDHYRPERRPPLESLPSDLAQLLAEFDAAHVRLRDARTEHERLAHRDSDEEARRADNAAAAEAARAGKKIPPAAAAAKLEKDRDEAARAVHAHRSAIKAIVNDLDDATSQTAESTRFDDSDHVRVDEAAAALITALERAVADRAAYDWMRGRSYSAAAQTWIVDVVPALKNHGMNRQGTPVVSARAVVTNLVDALMED